MIDIGFRIRKHGGGVTGQISSVNGMFRYDVRRFQNGKRTAGQALPRILQIVIGYSCLGLVARCNILVVGHQSMREMQPTILHQILHTSTERIPYPLIKSRT